MLNSLEGQSMNDFEVILVDNGSTDGSCSFAAANYPWVHILELSDNFGFCRAVNEEDPRFESALCPSFK